MLASGLVFLPGEKSYAASASEENTGSEAGTFMEDDENEVPDAGLEDGSTDSASDQELQPSDQDQTEQTTDESSTDDESSIQNDFVETSTEQDVKDTENEESVEHEDGRDQNQTDSQPSSGGIISQKGTVNAKTLEKNSYVFNVSGNGSSFTIEAQLKVSGYVFGELYVDGTVVKNFSNKTSIPKQSFKLQQFGTGYHTVMLWVYKVEKNTKKLQHVLCKEYIPYNGITDKPTYKGKFNVNSSSFTYYPYNMGMENQRGKLYMEYSSNGGKSWKRTGYMEANSIKLYIDQAYKISGLKANTNYKTRIRYGTYVTYNKIDPEDYNMPKTLFNELFGSSKGYIGDGKSYFFGGPVLNTATIKTGKANKLKVKSIKVKAVKVKRHKVRHYGYYTGVYLYTEKFYTCKFKVTIKLKKKPGTKGIMVNGRYLKGNKKKYTTTFTPYPNYYTKKPPKGLKKYKVSVCSVQNKSYGGYSPSKTKKVKIRR
jgi:hypothetical protein